MTVEELVQLSEETTTGLRHNRSEPYRKAFMLLEGKGDEKRREEMRWEALAHDLVPCLNGERFREEFVAETESGETIKYPDLQRDFPAEAVAYYRSRVVETKNPVLRARYADLVWVLVKDGHVALAAVDSYLEVSELYFAEGRWFEAADSVVRALTLSHEINSKKQLAEAAQRLTGFVAVLSQSKEYMPIIRFVQPLVDVTWRLSSVVDLEALTEALQKAAEYLRQYHDDNLHWERNFLNLLVKLYRAMKRPELVRETTLRTAESLIEEAAWARANAPSGNMVAASLYEEAVQVYQEIGGFKERVDELLLAIAACNKAARASEYQTVSTEVNVPRDTVERRLNFYRENATDADTFPAILAQDRKLVPSWDEALELAKELEAEFPFLHFATIHSMAGDRRIKTISGDEDRLRHRGIENMLRSYRLYSLICLSELYDQFFSRFEDGHAAFVRFMERSSIISRDRLPLIELGIRHYCCQDYVSTTHLAVFQVEGVLRDMLGQVGHPTYRIKDGWMQEKPLASVLGELKKVGGLDSDLLEFMSICLSEPTGLNLRNNIAHGLVTVGDLTRTEAELLLYFLLRLSIYRIHQARKHPAKTHLTRRLAKPLPEQGVRTDGGSHLSRLSTPVEFRPPKHPL